MIPPNLAALVPQPPDFRLDWAAVTAAMQVVERLSATRQDPRWHAEGDVGIHTRLCCEELAAMPDWQSLDAGARDVLFLAAVLHDLGKVTTTKEEEDGAITSRGHSRRGSVEARGMLWRLGVPFPEREAVCRLIALHQEPFFVAGRDDPAWRLHRMSHEVRLDHLAILAAADALGRQCLDQKDWQDAVDGVALFRMAAEDEHCLYGPRAMASAHTRWLYLGTRPEPGAPRRLPDWPAHEHFRCTVTVMCGLPAAGKDSWIRAHRPTVPVVSLDDIRAEMEVESGEAEGEVVQAARAQARKLLAAGQDFVWNATHLSRQMRAKTISLLADYGARVEIVYVEVPAGELFSRNNRRADKVPESALLRMIQRWEPPLPWEGHHVMWLAGGEGDCPEDVWGGADCRGCR